MSIIRDDYLKIVAATGEQLNWDLIYKFIKTMSILCAPIISHCSEHVWKEILKEKGTIFDQRLPEISDNEIDPVLLEANAYLQKTISAFRSKIETFTKPPKKATQKQNPYPTNAQVFVALTYPEWYQQILNLLNDFYQKDGTIPSEPRVISQLISSDPKYAELEKRKKKVMPIVSEIISEFEKKGPSCLSLTTNFNEQEILQENLPYIIKTLKLEKIDIQHQQPSSGDTGEVAHPGKPLILFDKPK